MNNKKLLYIGYTGILLFMIWTVLIQIVDVQPIGVNGTNIGFATMNTYFHTLTGVHMLLYTITDWLGLVPLFVCMIFGVLGFIQLLARRNLCKVDYDLLLLGIYYIIVILAYFIFEMYPINYRPILINGYMEASYPSSTTLLVVTVMPTLVFQVNRRLKNNIIQKVICILTNSFTICMVLGRLISGVHWMTDIIGSLLFSIGLFYIYKASVNTLEVYPWNFMKNYKNLEKTEDSLKKN